MMNVIIEPNKGESFSCISIFYLPWNSAMKYMCYGESPTIKGYIPGTAQPNTRGSIVTINNLYEDELYNEKLYIDMLKRFS